MDAELVDRIYECAFVPEHWPAVLDEVATIAGARGAVLFTARPGTGRGILRWLASDPVREDMEAYLAGGFLDRDVRPPRVLAATHAGFLNDDYLFAPGEWETDDTIRDYYRARGLGWTAITGVPLPTGDWIIVSAERQYEHGPVGREVLSKLDALRPHLARGAMMAQRLQLERARVASQALADIGLPALVFDGSGTVLAANSLIEALEVNFRWRPRDRFALKDRVADAVLREAIAALDSAGAGGARSFPIRDADANPVLVAHMTPVRRDARDIFSRSAGVLMLTPITLPGAPPAELVRSLFDLTAAEARVARGVAAGDTLDEIAAQSQVSRNTVRTQLRGVLEKTGCRRQAEVVALLSRLAPATG